MSYQDMMSQGNTCNVAIQSFMMNDNVAKENKIIVAEQYMKQMKQISQFITAQGEQQTVSQSRPSRNPRSRSQRKPDVTGFGPAPIAEAPKFTPTTGFGPAPIAEAPKRKPVATQAIQGWSADTQHTPAPLKKGIDLSKSHKPVDKMTGLMTSAKYDVVKMKQTPDCFFEALNHSINSDVSIDQLRQTVSSAIQNAGIKNDPRLKNRVSEHATIEDATLAILSEDTYIEDWMIPLLAEAAKVAIVVITNKMTAHNLKHHSTSALFVQQYNNANKEEFHNGIFIEDDEMRRVLKVLKTLNK